MSVEGQITRAVLTAQTGPRKDKAVTVHFNPVSLEYTVSNTLEKKGKGDKAKQFVSQTSGKLSFQILFDTTEDGSDVRGHTEKIAALMQPDEERTPAIILFEWGSYKFQGMLENYKETLDFFAPSGVPLRASISLTLAAQDVVFSPGPDEAPRAPDAVAVPPGANGLQDTASQAGDPRAMRDLGAANGEESLRFPTSLSLEVSAGVTLNGPVAFSASASLGLGVGGGLGAGFGLGVSGGAGFGVSAGLGLDFGGGGAASRPSAGAPATPRTAASPSPGGEIPSENETFGGSTANGGAGGGAAGGRAAGTSTAGRPSATGGAVPGASSTAGVPARSVASSAGTPGATRASASAGVPARAGAFAGLRTVPVVRPGARRLNVEALRPAPEPISTHERATFDIGGRARNPWPMSLSADSGLKFDEE